MGKTARSSANQIGTSPNLWVMTNYGLRQVWLSTELTVVTFRAHLTLDTEPSSAGEAECFLVDLGAGVCYTFV